MNRNEFNIEFVGDDFSIAKTESCLRCGYQMCFLPDIKSLIKKDCKAVIGLLKTQGIKVKEVDRIKVKEWACHHCKTIYINIQEEIIMF
jgi:hypothetical protein